MSFNKKISSIIIGIATLCFTSCEKSLVEKPESVMTPIDFYKTENDCIASVNACYQVMKDNFISLGYGVNIHLDNLTDLVGSAPSFFGEFHNNSFTSSNTYIIQMWNGFYKTIAACNTTIARVEGAPVNDELKKRIIGEARFLRAINYYYMVLLWGDLPLKLTLPTASEDANVPRSPIEDVYEAIINDLAYAEENCWGVGESRSLDGVSFANNKGRGTKGAAKALLAKVYLKLASTSRAASARTDAALVNNNTGQVDGLSAYKQFDPQTYYTLCIQKCNEVEALGYALNADFMKNFTTKNGIESLFEIQATGELGYGSRLAPFYSPAYSGLYGGTWGGTIGLLRAFLHNKGPFRIFKAGDYNFRPAVTGDAPASTRSSQLDITDYRYKNGFVQEYNNKNAANRLFSWDIYDVQYKPTPAGVPAVNFLYVSKYLDPQGTTVDANTNNWILLRFADVLLMKAESVFELGDKDGAWEILKRVHNRDNNQNTEAGNQFTADYATWISRFPGTATDDKFREAILYERMAELLFEGHRFIDLCRMGKLEEKCAVVSRARTRKGYYLPIAQSEINTNKSITSKHNNPGYESN